MGGRSELENGRGRESSREATKKEGRTHAKWRRERKREEQADDEEGDEEDEVVDGAGENVLNCRRELRRRVEHARPGDGGRDRNPR